MAPGVVLSPMSNSKLYATGCVEVVVANVHVSGVLVVAVPELVEHMEFDASEYPELPVISTSHS